MSDRKRLLLTGSAGFIGSNFIRKLIYEKYPYEVFSVDKIANSSMLNNIYQHKLHEFYIADICDIHIMDKIFEYVKPEIVVHMAAESHVDTSIVNPNIFITSNILGTQNLINLSLKYKVEKFLQVSTDEVFGSLSSESDAMWTEDSPTNPKNPYSASKASAEMLVIAAANTHGLPFIITRSCNNYGPRQTADKLIPKVIKCILNNQPIPVYGKGAQIREWMHVYDNCSAFLKILEKGQVGKIYNISTNHELSNLKLVKKIIEIIGKGEISFVQDRLGHDFRYAINSSKLRDLGWSPVFKFDDGLKHTIDWYLDNKFFLNT